jgi:UrcA family protein
MNMPTIPNTVLACALTGVLIAGCAQAIADTARPNSLEPTVTVRFADLDLHSAAGARVLYRRIQGAAQTVCRRGRWATWKECYRATIDVTVRQIDRPALTALHQDIRKAKPG